MGFGRLEEKILFLETVSCYPNKLSVWADLIESICHLINNLVFSSALPSYVRFLTLLWVEKENMGTK